MKKIGKFRVMVFSAVVMAVLFSGIYASDYYARPLLDKNISLSTVGSPTSYSAVGDVIEYTYIVENIRSTIFLENIVVTDDLIDNISCSGDEIHAGRPATGGRRLGPPVAPDQSRGWRPQQS